MIRNGKDIPTGTVISTQVCVIGSGPAGITAAWHLQKAGKKVTLIEGSRDFRDKSWEDSWPDKVLLYGGVADGLFEHNERNFLILPNDQNRGPAWERERIYGGTSNHWAGQCRPLDPITFEERQGFPGWPVSRADLDPYYAKAATFLNLHGDDFAAKYWANVLGAEVPNLEGFDAEMYQFIDSQYTNFATRTFGGKTIRDGKTIGQTDVDVILNASLLDIDHSGGRVSRLHVASLDDNTRPATEFFIKADAYVLACGAVANARQLLLSNAGNEHYQVGHYFMCHPIAGGVVTITPDTESFLTKAEKRFMSGEEQNGARWRDENDVAVEGRFSPNAEAQRMWKIGGCWFDGKSDGYYYEMAPKYESRVTLDDTLDPVFKQKQTRITWELSDTDKKTYEHSTLLYKNAIEKINDKIKVSFAAWEQVKGRLVVNGHHIGTTRMSDQPQDGVVDKNLKVHTLANLYVAGSSVYPSAGISNPTFTIVTLSIRLAEHLVDVLS